MERFWGEDLKRRVWEERGEGLGTAGQGETGWLSRG